MADAAPAAPPADAPAADLPQNTQDLTIFVQQLLGQMQQRFQTMSDGIIGKIDDMGSRIDELEKSIGDIMQQAGIEDEGDEEGGGEGEGEGGEGAK